MKTITLKARWIDEVDLVTREEYPAGWSGEVTDDRAARAKRAGVLAPTPKPLTETRD